MNITINVLIDFATLIAIFLVLTFIGVFILNKIKNSSNRLFNLREFLPEDEIHTLRQVFFLILMACCFVNFFYSLIAMESQFIYLAIFDIALSLFIAITLDKNSIKNKILLLLVIPYGSLFYLFWGYEFTILVIELIHIIVFIYFIKMYFDKFMEYTESNGLGVAIILLFTIVFVSFLFTQFVENKNPLDALVMVSNAFTSNGYAVLGESIGGKINSIFLVWGGYIISGAGTATLTAAILLRHFNKRVKELEMLIEDGGDE